MALLPQVSPVLTERLKAALSLCHTVKNGRGFLFCTACAFAGWQYPTGVIEDRMKRLDYLCQAFCVFCCVPPFLQNTKLLNENANLCNRLTRSIQDPGVFARPFCWLYPEAHFKLT